MDNHANYFGTLYLDKEKDIIVDLFFKNEDMHYVLRTPNHKTGNLITNLARICDLPITKDANGLKIVEGKLPCYYNREHGIVYIFRLRDTKVANIYPDGKIEYKASIPSIAKTLMSQTKSYHIDFDKTVVKTYIFNDCKFHTDLHTHLNANLSPDILIALGIFHQIRYPLYYIKKLRLRCTKEQEDFLHRQRSIVSEQYHDSTLIGKYLDRKIDDNTFINFADFILNNIENAAYNIPLIRASLAIMKDGQAVFTNLEKVYLYRYVFTKGQSSNDTISLDNIDQIPDTDIVKAVQQMIVDKQNASYAHNTLYQNKLLWTARMYQENAITYAEISDTNLIKPDVALDVLSQIHEVMPSIYEETHVRLRFLAAFRRIPLTIVKDHIQNTNPLQDNLRVLDAICMDPYIAGSDIVGEELNDIRDLKPLLQGITQIAKKDSSFVIRIHGGENDSLKDNVLNSVQCVEDSLSDGQKMPNIRIGHGLYTANLSSRKGKVLLDKLRDNHVVLEFQITSNVRLNNLTSLKNHPLKQYLANQIHCVQGTDGGALYGTDSVDEQLALQKMLDLSTDDLQKMVRVEKHIISESEKAFQLKNDMCKDAFVEMYHDAMKKNTHAFDWIIGAIHRVDANTVLSDRISPLPKDKKPVVLCGGSFNNSSHQTRMKKELCEFVDVLLDTCNPQTTYFVIGDGQKYYEKYLMEHNDGKFKVYSYVPRVLQEKDVTRLKNAPVKYRVSIESESMGIYKSVAYEIFKQQPSILIALDGNSAAANVIQEANNSKYPCRIFINESAVALRTKANSLQGYITMFKDATIVDEIQKYL